MKNKSYIAAPPGELYWRYEVCPHPGAKVLVLSKYGVCTVAHWYGKQGEFLVAWCPLPKTGTPPPDITKAPFWARVRHAIALVMGRL